MRKILLKIGVLVILIVGLLVINYTDNVLAEINSNDADYLLNNYGGYNNGSWISLPYYQREIVRNVYMQGINAGLTHQQAVGEARSVWNSVGDSFNSSQVANSTIISPINGLMWNFQKQENGNFSISRNTSPEFHPSVPPENRNFQAILNNQQINNNDAEVNNATSQIDNSTAQDNPSLQGQSSNNGQENNTSNNNGNTSGSGARQVEDCGSEGLEGVDFLVFHGPLVPCGVKKTCANSEGKTGELSINRPCTICHFIILIKNVFDLLLSLIITVSLFMLTVAGVLYIVSSGGQMTGIAKGIIEKTLLGFGIFLLSWLLVYTLLNMLSVRENVLGKGTADSWFQFSCDTKSSFYREPTQQHSDDDDQQHSDDDDQQHSDDDNEPVARSYDPNIESQLSDAAPETQELMDCMDRHLPTAAANRISSISDSQGIDRCVNNYSKPPCAHGEFSCHYGGRNCRGKSYAVDYGNENYASDIISAANSCGASALNEGNHIHVSIGSQNDCGCDNNV